MASADHHTRLSIIFTDLHNYLLTSYMPLLKAAITLELGKRR